ncbi:MAG: carboxypeptidase-like regulatory domain-containing protein [Gemmatimonadales bacterium]
MRTRDLVWCLALSWLVGLGAASVLQAQGETGTVQGRLTLLDSAAAGARVIARSSADSGFEAATVTDADGSFTISDVPLGEVQVLVYQSEGELTAQGEGVLDEPGEVLLIELHPPA